MNTQGAIQRAELFSDVDELKAWKKSFEMKQRDLIQWQAMIVQRLSELEASLDTTIKGCGVLVDCDTAIGERIDVYNKRVRTLEMKVKSLEARVK